MPFYFFFRMLVKYWHIFLHVCRVPLRKETERVVRLWDKGIASPVVGNRAPISRSLVTYVQKSCGASHAI